MPPLQPKSPFSRKLTKVYTFPSNYSEGPKGFPVLPTLPTYLKHQLSQNVDGLTPHVGNSTSGHAFLTVGLVMLLLNLNRTSESTFYQTCFLMRFPKNFSKF